jgi:hypothetical protein
LKYDEISIQANYNNDKINKWYIYTYIWPYRNMYDCIKFYRIESFLNIYRYMIHHEHKHSIYFIIEDIDPLVSVVSISVFQLPT